MTLAAAMAASVCADNFAYGAGFKRLYSFDLTQAAGGWGYYAGAQPTALVAARGTLYGTTESGGLYNNGTVFSLTTSGSESVLHSFAGLPDGAAPNSLIAFDGALFGATWTGGGATCAALSEGCGTVFGIAPLSGRERIVQSFQAGNQNVSPNGYVPTGLVDLNDTLYGIASYGGPLGFGAVFSLRHGVETVIYAFKGGTDGAYPNVLIRIGGALYGTTTDGGGAGCLSGECGTIFKLTAGGVETVMHAFNGGDDGAYPDCLLDGGGALYACVGYGGRGYGKIVELKGTTMITLHAFRGGADGDFPSSLTHIGQTLYGTTSVNGGTLFALSKTGHASVLHRFSFRDGTGPAGLIHVAGTLYGVAAQGGESDAGTVFSFTP